MAGKLTKNVARIVTLVVVVAIVAVGAFFFLSGSDDKKVTARFTAAVGIYEGTPVRQLGVNVGDVTKVTPKGGYVEVEMEYENQYSLPGNATAVEVANSLVSDRFIQISAYPGQGSKMANNATIPQSRTAAPAELDDIYKALDKLSTALGPDGANSDGSLANLLRVGSANLKGNGAALGQSIQNLSRATTTLADGREDLFGTVTNLRRFTGALKESDKQVKSFNRLLAAVAGNLADERANLGQALKQLGLALNEVNTFVRANASKIHKDVTGLRKVTDILVRQKASLDETLSLAPVALANIVHSYQPNLGVLATRSNLASLFDPGQICAVISVASGIAGKLPIIGGLTQALTEKLVSTCNTAIAGSKDPDVTKLLTDPGIKALAMKLLGGLQTIIPGVPFTGGGSN